jgi:hypothetical protein
MSSVAPVDTGSGRGIAIVETSPESITLHRIEDSELEVLMNVARPYALAFSTMSAGGFLGLIPSIATIIEKADEGLKGSELITVGVGIACLVAALIFGTYAIRGLIDANRALARIRSRPKTPC